jgi:hypothetical protein
MMKFECDKNSKIIEDECRNSLRREYCNIHGYPKTKKINYKKK